MLHADKLPLETKRLWKALETERALSGAVLIGGSALALRIGHRQSEDLDFSFPAAKLPVERLRALRKKYSLWQPKDNPAAYDEFLEAGMSLHDYQQDYLSESNVKITFFAEDKPLWPLLVPTNKLGPRVADLDEIFALKALVCAKRSNSRDWLDIFTLIKNHGFTLLDFETVYRKTNQLGNLDIAFNRMRSGKTDRNDPGFHSLLPNPPTVEDLTNFFKKGHTNYMIEKTRAVLKPNRRS